MNRQVPLIFHIRRFALDDGPGIRSTVFFKGCPLACVWCHNPEAMALDDEMAFYPQRCIRCGICQDLCPAGAIRKNAQQRLDRENCTVCGICADECPTMALQKIGGHIPVDELVALLMRDRIFYETSGGGVTFSGGEPTLAIAYLADILGRLKGENIHTALQTCGQFELEPFVDELLPHLDRVYYDVKILDPDLHRRHTGRENGLILENLTRLSCMAPEKIVPRVPLVPGITATRSNLLGIASFLRELGFGTAELLPYHPGGIPKRAALGREIPSQLPATPLPLAQENLCRELFFSELAGTHELFAAARPSLI